jgi:probable F420-dependent oxidoreductase
MPGVPLATTVPLGGCGVRGSVELAGRARDWGYTAAWGAEVDGPDAFTLLGALAASTDLELGVGVVPVQTRTVFTLGMSAVSLAQLTGGRFTLGIGASSEVLVERFAGQPFDRPLSHLREAATALRPILRGERSTFTGDYVSIGGYRPPTPPPAPVPLFLGSLNQRSLRLAGAIADGLCINQIAPQHVPKMLDAVQAGAADAGRDLAEFPVMARLFCVVTDDPAAARLAAARTFGPYVATSVYNRFYRWMGYEEEAAEISRAAAVKDRDRMATVYADRMANDLFAIGTVQQVVARLHDYVDAGVTIPVIAPLAADADTAATILREIGTHWD